MTMDPWRYRLETFLAVALTLNAAGCGGEEPLGSEAHGLWKPAPIAIIGGGDKIITDDPPMGGDTTLCPSRLPSPTKLKYVCKASVVGEKAAVADQIVRLTSKWCWKVGGTTFNDTATVSAQTGSDGRVTATLWSTKAHKLTCSVFTPSGTKLAERSKQIAGGLPNGTTIAVDALVPTHRVARGQWLHFGGVDVLQPLNDVVAKMSAVKGNPDLYIRYGSRPTLTRYAWRGDGGVNRAETYENLDMHGPSRVYVSVYGKSEGLFELDRGSYRTIPAPRTFVPGEKHFSSSRPQTWTTEDDGREGLDFRSYDSVVRSPYIQNVTNHSATLLWRVSVPKDQRPSEFLSLFAEALIAPEGTDLTNGTRYTTPTIKVRDVSNSSDGEYAYAYVYDRGVGWNVGPYPPETCNDVPCDPGYTNLNRVHSRPVLEFAVTFEDLQPGTNYHYQVRSETVNPTRRITTTSPIGIWTLAHDIQFRTAPDLRTTVGTLAFKAATAATSTFTKTSTPPTEATTKEGPSTVKTSLFDKPTFGPSAEAVRFLAMGDLGPGNNAPSYFYDVADLFHDVARKHGASLWLALGDLDNDTDGHPNAYDPFFFNVYNAYVGSAGTAGRTSNVLGRAESTGVAAFSRAPYLGLLGGLPVYPTFGNHDICTESRGSYDQWERSYAKQFVHPGAEDREDSVAFGSRWLADAAATFNAEGHGHFYTFRRGKVIFLSLGVPSVDCDLGAGRGDWKTFWGQKQSSALKTYLHALEAETAKTDVWVVAYFHDYGWAFKDRKVSATDYPLRKTLARYGVDLVLTGHDHKFYDGSIFLSVPDPFDASGADVKRDYRAVVVGTGGFTDDFPLGINASPIHRPGFIMVEAEGDTLRYWKYDTHDFDDDGSPLGRSTLNPRVMEFRSLKKLGRGRHKLEHKRTLARPYDWNSP
ncbi:MAG: metallophosphoesterase [Deltaproteobacteria bacterium]|nr:metallophosphoesterase [Deltaproteobacteria bacterium]